MRKMGIAALYRRSNTSRRHPRHAIYPYLLRKLVIERPNHVWATDVTYIPMARGFVYLVAVMDWFSRKVLSWRISNSLNPGGHLNFRHLWPGQNPSPGSGGTRDDYAI